MRLRWAAALAISLLVWTLVPSADAAWQEAHEVGDDARARVEADGTATIAHTLRWHVLHGPVRSIDVAGVDPRAALDPSLTVTTAEGAHVAAHAQRTDDGLVRIIVDDPHGLVRGTFTIDIAWKTDLAATGALTNDGATWRLALAGIPASDGLDVTHLVLDVPAALDPPQAVTADTGATDDSEQASLRRDPGRDVIDLVRPHVARGEAPAWTIRLDKKALTLPALEASQVSAVMPEPDRIRPTVLGATWIALGMAFAALVLAKSRSVGSRCAARNVSPRPLIPLAAAIRATLGGVSFAAGVTAEIAGQRFAGGALLSAACLLVTYLAPRADAAPRGPGRWLALRPGDAFARAPRTADWLDVDTAAGRLVGVAACAIAGVAAAAAARLVPHGAWVVGVAAAAACPALLTGRASQLRPHLASDAAAWLERAYRRLASSTGLRVAPWARVVAGGGVDELRLLVAPRAAMSGFLGVELGLAWSTTSSGWTCAPEVLVRVLDATAASARLADVAPGYRPVPGRRPDERVVRLVPRAASRRAAVALARELAAQLAERRLAPEGALWSGSDRRQTREPIVSGPTLRQAC